MNGAAFNECLCARMCMHHRFMPMMRPGDIIKSRGFIVVSMIGRFIFFFLDLPFDIMTNCYHSGVLE